VGRCASGETPGWPTRPGRVVHVETPPTKNAFHQRIGNAVRLAASRIAARAVRGGPIILVTHTELVGLGLLAEAERIPGLSRRAFAVLALKAAGKAADPGGSRRGRPVLDRSSTLSGRRLELPTAIPTCWANSFARMWSQRG